MNYSKATQNLIDRQCRNVERADFELNKQIAEELILQTYDLFKLVKPKKIVWCKDIFEEIFQSSAWSASSASSARSAWSAWSASSARSAWSAWSARPASLAWSALDYDFDWYIFEFEYCQNPNKDKMPNDNDKIYLEYCELLMQAKEAGLGYRVEWEDTLYLVPTPMVKINSRNQFHSDTTPAICWKNASELFYLNDVNFPKDLWTKVVSKKMPFQDILAIKDIDQRTQAMKFGDIREFLVHTKSTLLNEIERFRTKYELWKTPKEAGIFTIDAYHIILKDPETGLEYMTGIAPEIGAKGNADECMAWKRGVDIKNWIEGVYA